jgi:hypothetical protein
MNAAEAGAGRCREQHSVGAFFAVTLLHDQQIGSAGLEWFIGELVTLAGPAYFFMQLLTVARYRGRWRVLALVPLLFMAPLAVHAGMAFAAGSNLWPVLVILASPVAFLYLLGLAVAKAIIN